jgi:hypothetical protein
MIVFEKISIMKNNNYFNAIRKTGSIFEPLNY